MGSSRRQAAADVTLGPGLAGLSDAVGRFSILAIDHRDSLRHFLRPTDPDSIAASEITALKIEIVAAIADLATGVMLEPEYSIPQVLDAGALPDGVGFLAALEAQGYLDDPAASPTTLLDGWSIDQAKACGASAAKLLLPYHPDRPLAGAQETFAREIAEGCVSVGLPLALEPLFYDLDSPEDRPRVVIETARRFIPMRPDLLKLPYPGSRQACERVSDMADMPWAMLSGGGSFEDFVDQFSIAAAAGCSGFMVGRALWGEAVRASAQDRPGILTTVVRPRFQRLLDVNANAA